jgi:uncharacterized protein YbjT (DUF2867 family)
MDKTILIIGGTGMLGRPVAVKFLQDEYRVRILTHSPERARLFFDERFDIRVGDVNDKNSLASAMEGCGTVHINLGVKFDIGKYDKVEGEGTANIVEVAKERGVERLTMISGNRVEPELAKYKYVASKLKAEKAVKEGGIPYTIFKCCWFFESLPLFIQGGKAIILGDQNKPVNWMAATDYAGMVARSIDTPEAKNRSLYLKGVTQASVSEALIKFCELVVPKAKVSSIPLWMARFAAFFSAKRQMKGLIEFMKMMDKHPEPGISVEAERILGPALTTLEDWCEEYKRRLTINR